MTPGRTETASARPRANLAWRLRSATLAIDRPLGVGIVNVTDDSFYRAARSGTPGQAIEDGVALVDAGFDLLDVGAVAARSGPAVPAAEEAGRLCPAVTGLVERTRVPVSADTFSPEVAREAIAAGAEAINYIGGGADPAMLEAVAEAGCGLVLTHIEGPPRQDREARDLGDPVEHLLGWFGERLDRAASAGIAAEQVVLDPGLDFDLTVDDDLEILRRLDELGALGRPLFVSLSRKDFLGAVLAGSWERRAAAEEREWATAAAAALAVAGGARLLRLHDASGLDALRVAAEVVDR